MFSNPDHIQLPGTPNNQPPPDDPAYHHTASLKQALRNQNNPIKLHEEFMGGTASGRHLSRNDRTFSISRRGITPILLENSKNLVFLTITFTNRLGYSLALGNLTHCAKEKTPIEFSHDHALHFSIYTPWLSKRWYLWRYKNTLKCWFCVDCSIEDLQIASDAITGNSTFPLLANITAF